MLQSKEYCDPGKMWFKRGYSDKNREGYVVVVWAFEADE